MRWLMEHFTLISAIVATLGGVGAAIAAYWKHRKLTLISAIMAALAGFGGVVGAYWEKQQQGKKSDENAALSREIARLAQENLAWATGGDSYIYLGTSKPVKGSDFVNTWLEVRGKYALRDVHVTVVESGVGGRGFIFDHHYGTVRPERTGYPAVSPSLRLPASGSQTVLVFINTLTRTLNQIFRFEKTNGDWKVATRVFELPSKKILFEEVESGFPKDETGNVRW